MASSSRPVWAFRLREEGDGPFGPMDYLERHEGFVQAYEEDELTTVTIVWWDE